MPLSSQTEIEEALNGVAGWLSPREAWVLHQRIHDLSPERPITVVEIGSSRGRSTIAAGHALAARANGGTLYAIDPQDDDRFQQLRTNLSSAGVESVVRIIRATSREARKQFAEPVDLIFIDGSHEYEDVRDDLRDWLPLVRPGGIVAVNDPFWWGVGRALRERLRLRGPLRSPRFVDNTLFFSYLPDAGWGREDDRQLFRVHACVLVGRIGGSLLALTGAAHVLPRRLKGALSRAIFRALAGIFSRALPPASVSASRWKLRRPPRSGGVSCSPHRTLRPSPGEGRPLRPRRPGRARPDS